MIRRAVLYPSRGRFIHEPVTIVLLPARTVQVHGVSDHLDQVLPDLS
jgi:hypothetical protein